MLEKKDTECKRISNQTCYQSIKEKGNYMKDNFSDGRIQPWQRIFPPYHRNCNQLELPVAIQHHSTYIFVLFHYYKFYVLSQKYWRKFALEINNKVLLSRWSNSISINNGPDLFADIDHHSLPNVPIVELYFRHCTSQEILYIIYT